MKELNKVTENDVLEKLGIEYTTAGCDSLLKTKSVKLFSIDKPTQQMVARIQQQLKQKCYKYLKKKRLVSRY
ncbi:hypothetical protein DPMN_105532 [Dreissena polymorpha]|uniref:Uncharacterized protein n=1 Tax=Dreissena polymorpha TaxID=45954 RepID=A0A9D4K3D1_DREPO|nr:hypothetical protein DPMN_105532 [Dreissena polymorpha]